MVSVGLTDTSQCPNATISAWADNTCVGDCGGGTGSMTQSRTCTDNGKGDCTSVNLSRIISCKTPNCPPCTYKFISNGQCSSAPCGKVGNQYGSWNVTSNGNPNCPPPPPPPNCDMPVINCYSSTSYPSPVCYYIFSQNNFGDGQNIFRGAGYNVVTLKNLVTGNYDTHIMCSGMGGFQPFTSTTESIKQITTYFPMNTSLNSRGVYLGRLGNQNHYYPEIEKKVPNFVGQSVVWGSWKGNPGDTPTFLTINNNGITITFWYMTGLTAYGTIVGLFGSGVNRIQITDVNGGRDFRFIIYSDSGWYNGGTSWDLSARLTNAQPEPWGFFPDGWAHCAFTLSSSGDAAFYLNGSLVSSSTGAPFPNINDKYIITSGQAGTGMGSIPWFGSPPQDIAGLLGIDGIAYFQSVLNLSQIQSIYSNGIH